MRVVVSGGTGFVGRALVHSLVGRGEDVVVLTRSRASSRMSLSAHACPACKNGGKVELASWGRYDKTQLLRDAARHSVRHDVRLPFSGRHLDIKGAFAERAKTRPMGVSRALARVGLRFEGTPHRGIDDARNIARLLPYALGRTPLPPVPNAQGPVRARSR